MIKITECKISCPCCGTPIPDTHPSFAGLRSNKVNFIRAQIVTLRSHKKPNIIQINQLKQQLVELGAEMPIGEEPP